MKVIVDTNVILDALTGRQPWNEAAEEIFLLAAKHPGVYWITSNVVTDIYYLMKKHYKEHQLTIDLLNRVLQLFSIYDTRGVDCINALHASGMTDFEDAVLVGVAKRNAVDYIVTRNIEDFKDESVKVVTPGEFVLLQNGMS